MTGTTIQDASPPIVVVAHKEGSTVCRGQPWTAARRRTGGCTARAAGL
jgi:hypothetical protein